MKEIQMENFKSFGKKVVVPFFPGFTAITGPNGSGKSNIGDAIRFVLGPKSSKAIRAGKLTDLIFNGGKDKKKAANYCTVSLVFDNSDRRLPIDADTVTLTRTIRRAPLKNNPDNYYSYFYINGKAASLSDFTNLLTHARISGDGYNLVKQGDVTSLIETGPVERRKVIDEIAGISAFDKDIEKAEKEKKEVEENIQRIGIVLEEINRQLMQLKKERDEAFRYKELQDRLYEAKAKIAHKKRIDVQEQLAELQRQVEGYEREKQKLEEMKKEKLQQYNEARKRLEEIEQKIAGSGGEEAQEIKEKIDALRTELAKVEERILNTKNGLKEVEKEKLNLVSSLEHLEKEIEENRVEAQEIENEIAEKEKEIEDTERELNELRMTLSQSDGASIEISRELVKLRQEYEETTTALHEVKLERERVVEKIDSLSTQIAELEETKGTYEFELKDVEWQISEASKERKEVVRRRARVEKELFEKKKEEAELSEQLKDVEQRLRVLQREHSQLKAEYEAKESVRKGYTTAVLRILEARDKGLLKGVHGTVAELAKVDPKYEVAMQVAGGQRLQAIIVDDDAVAAEAIEFLRKNDLGRATFLPLNKMILGKPRAKAILAVQDKKSHGFALDLISFRKEYESAFWYVFGDTVVVEDLDAARQLMGGVRLVTLDGDVVEASGAMKGGSVKEHVAFSQVDRLKLDEAEEKLREALETHDVLIERLKELRGEIERLHGELQELNANTPVALDNLEVQRKEFSAKIMVVSNELEEKLKEKMGYEEQLKDLDQRIEELQSKLDELEKIKEEKGKLLLKGKGKDLTQRVRELEEKLFSIKDNLVQLKGNYDSLKKQLEFMESRREEYVGKIQEIDAEITSKKEMLEKLMEDKSRHREEFEALLSVESKMTGKIKGLSEEKDRIFRETVSLETEIDKITTRIESYVDLISRTTYRIPTLEETLQDLEEEISRYDMTVDVSDLPSVESLMESVKLIEENMRELEPVNMRALEEYEHQAKRKEKLEEDIRHLREQKRNLNRVVKEIVKKKKDRFYEVFNEINENFKQVYSRLSEGGEASLELENPEDPFDGGLTIKVRPRGKKVLHLNALSGGEKSMASLALIFAIQNYDPSPFYVLDEVDMYLDSINAEAVSRMIKENASHTQFIMVSLRKVAIKEADHIYGVTMREDGITEMIGTVDLSSIGPKGEILTTGKGGSGG